jgi:hypothetical protein
LEATGHDAHEVLEALVELANRGFDQNEATNEPNQETGGAGRPTSEATESPS